MKQNINISANLYEPVKLKKLVETLASHHAYRGYSGTAIPQDWTAIDTSCVQAYVMGKLDLGINKRKNVVVPFDSCFLFTCIKPTNGLFNLEWSSSLS